MAVPSHKKSIFSKAIDEFLIELAELGKFTVDFFKEGARPPLELKETMRQAYHVGVKSLPLVSLTGFILGLVLLLQSRPTMVEFGAGAYLPAMSSISIIREIGPLVTALICAGKIGSGISAELGSMRVTEQIDAMEVSGTNPFKYLVVTRVAATTLMIPLLTIYADAIALMGAFAGSNVKDQINIGFFFNHVFDSLAFTDSIPAFIKTFFFGFAIGIISSTKGYNSNKGTEGVGLATNSSVVSAMVSVIIIDMAVTQITGILGYL